MFQSLDIQEGQGRCGFGRQTTLETVGHWRPPDRSHIEQRTIQSRRRRRTASHLDRLGRYVDQKVNLKNGRRQNAKFEMAGGLRNKTSSLNREPQPGLSRPGCPLNEPSDLACDATLIKQHARATFVLDGWRIGRGGCCFDNDLGCRLLTPYCRKLMTNFALTRLRY